jgi:uncharacterized protein YegP (UPF0339 family)
MQYVELTRNVEGKWYLRVVGANGEIIATSETYATKWNARRAAKVNFPTLEVKEK